MFDENKTWTYSSDTDKMSGKTTEFAYTTSINTEELNIPYEGGTTMDITIRNHPRMGTDAYISVNQGLFNHVYNENSITVKFDNEAPKKYSVTEPSDNSYDMFFLQNPKKFISKLKKSKKVIIEVEFYNDGNRQI